jgi:hypothetical protein
MKNAVNCETLCDLHESVSHQIFERTLHAKAYIPSSAIIDSEMPSGIEVCVTIFRNALALRCSRADI